MSAPPPDISFDEFRSVRARDRAKQDRESEDATGLRQRQASSTVPASKKASASKASSSTTSQNRNETSNNNKQRKGGLGEFLEMPQFQAFVVTLLVVDAFAVNSALLLGNYIAAVDASSSSGLNVPSESFDFLFGLISLQMIYDGLLAFTSFALVFFSFEVGLVLMAFRSRTTGQWGYVLDAILVSIQVYGELFGWGLATHLLNLLRYWRLIRLQAYMVNREVLAHNATKAEMDTQATALRKAEADSKRVQLDLVREQEARVAVDDMLTSYKEEVDTLNEALKIAAMDIAEVAEADDDLLSDDDDLDEQLSTMGPGSQVDDEGYSDAAGSIRDRAMNKASMLREARKDNMSFGGSSNASNATGRKSQGTVTFKVSADGSYEQR